MTAIAIIAQLNAAGVRISRRGDNLLAEPRTAVTEPLLVLMRAHKGELLAALSDQSPTSCERPQPTPTYVESPQLPPNVELRALVDSVAMFHGFTPAQTIEAQEIAQSDAVAALECFRLLVAELPTTACKGKI